jgi:hypothetical protein
MNFLGKLYNAANVVIEGSTYKDKEHHDTSTEDVEQSSDDSSEVSSLPTNTTDIECLACFEKLKELLTFIKNFDDVKYQVNDLLTKDRSNNKFSNVLFRTYNATAEQNNNLVTNCSLVGDLIDKSNNGTLCKINGEELKITDVIKENNEKDYGKWYIVKILSEKEPLLCIRKGRMPKYLSETLLWTFTKEEKMMDYFTILEEFELNILNFFKLKLKL